MIDSKEHNEKYQKEINYKRKERGLETINQK